MKDYNIVYGDGTKLVSAGQLKAKTFKSGNEGYTLWIPIAEAEKALTIARRERKDAVTFMAFEKKAKSTPRTASYRPSKPSTPSYKESTPVNLDDEIPF